MVWGARNLISTQPRAAVVVRRTLAARALAGRLVALVLIIIWTLLFARPLPIFRREALSTRTALVVVVAVLARALALLLVALVGLVVGAFVEALALARALLEETVSRGRLAACAGRSFDRRHHRVSRA